MTNPLYRHAMHLPISCTGYGDCKNGKAPCRSPLTCSGMPADEAIEQFRLHRIANPVVIHEPQETDDIASIWQAVCMAVACACAGMVVLAALRHFGWLS